MERCFFGDFVKLEVKMDIEMYPPVHSVVAESYLKFLIIKYALYNQELF